MIRKNFTIDSRRTATESNVKPETTVQILGNIQCWVHRFAVLKLVDDAPAAGESIKREYATKQKWTTAHENKIHCLLACYGPSAATLNWESIKSGDGH